MMANVRHPSPLDSKLTRSLTLTWLRTFPGELWGGIFQIFLIYEAYPQSRSIVIIISAHGVCNHVCPWPLFKISRTKQFSSENSDRYWWYYWSGWVNHWWHTMSCLLYNNIVYYITKSFICMKEKNHKTEKFVIVGVKNVSFIKIWTYCIGPGPSTPC